MGRTGRIRNNGSGTARSVEGEGGQYAGARQATTNAFGGNGTVRRTANQPVRQSGSCPERCPGTQRGKARVKVRRVVAGISKVPTSRRTGTTVG